MSKMGKALSILATVMGATAQFDPEHNYQSNPERPFNSGYFRFARPGSVRVDAQSSVEVVYVSAYLNTNGTVVVPVVNAAHFACELTVDLFGVNVTTATAYLTDNNHSVTRIEQYTLNGSTFSASVEPRAMKTFFLQ
ncbi:hypothetical protein LTR85_001976 [Meristemomyces frigidus]|nr:hypothetical protein LTR85_001976 [Meristemomyces frigidus]